MKDPEVNEVFLAYNLCKSFNCLPKAGGLGEQDAYLMELFSVIEAQIAKEKQKKQDGIKEKIRGARQRF